MSKTHELKVWPEFYEAIDSCVKNFDLRNNDRDFNVHDLLHFKEWHPETKEYTGAEVFRTVTYILKHRPGAGCAATLGLQPGYVILGLD